MAGGGRRAKKGAGAAAGGGEAKRHAKAPGPARKAPRAAKPPVAGRSARTPKAAAPAKPVASAAPAAAPAAAPRKIPKKKVKRILDDIHQVLSGHDVRQAVNVHFTAAAAGPCYQYRLVQDENGDWVYRMVEVPCPGE